MVSWSLDLYQETSYEIFIFDHIFFWGGGGGGWGWHMKTCDRRLLRPERSSAARRCACLYFFYLQVLFTFIHRISKSLRKDMVWETEGLSLCIKILMKDWACPSLYVLWWQSAFLFTNFLTCLSLLTWKWWSGYFKIQWICNIFFVKILFSMKNVWTEEMGENIFSYVPQILYSTSHHISYSNE